MTSLRAALVLVAFAVAAGCNDGNDTGSFRFTPDGGAALDGSADQAASPADLGASGDAWPGTCDPVLQNCPAGQQCTGGCNVMGVMAKVFTCAVPVAGANATNGQDCGAGCARGHDCYVVPAGDGGTRSVCRKYCNVDADCPSNRCVAEGLVCTAGDTNPIGRLCAL
jgi:hypothetical protein